MIRTSDAVALQTVPALRTSLPGAIPAIPRGQYAERMAELYRRAGVDWVAVYGDREHSANLEFLCGFDPRFEEALLLLGPDDRRALLVGNEGIDYARHTTPEIELLLCQSFSLLGQSRTRAPRLDDVLARAGVARGAAVAVAGWKYLGADETDEPQAPAFVPAGIVAALRGLTRELAVDCTALLMDAGSGLRATNTAAQIAAFEWGAARASAAMMRIVAGTRPGMSELEAAAQLGYAGEPLSCNVMLSADDVAVVGLRSPGGRVIAEGDAITGAVGYPGGLCSRAGVLRRDPDPAFLAEYVAPYFAALATWYETVRVGAAGAEIHDAVLAAIGDAPFAPMLNPGHLGSFDEWMHSPIVAGGSVALRSGAVLQCDIIPGPMPPGRALNGEDTIAIADEPLQGELAREHPELWERVTARRTFVRDTLGIAIGEDVLPLSDSVGHLAPFWLDPSLVCGLSG